MIGWAVEGAFAHAAGISILSSRNYPAGMLINLTVLPNYCSQPSQPISFSLPLLLFIYPSVCWLSILLLLLCSISAVVLIRISEILLILSNLQRFSISRGYSQHLHTFAKRFFYLFLHILQKIILFYLFIYSFNYMQLYYNFTLLK